MADQTPQIIIPMSGFGERFRRAGYYVPKPLIPVDGKPIIAHVLDMFPGETDVVFICNEDHLAEPAYQMEAILKRYCPAGTIVAIAPHRLGPVNAVLQAKNKIDPERPVIVNYCDFTCYWDYDEFKQFVETTDCDGCIPAYRGFHPHSLGSTYYAYVKETGLWMDDIQEKTPWTDTPMEEFASSGTYYFKSGQLCVSALEAQMARCLDVNGEFYVSLAYKIMQEAGARTAVYELQHFMQWGTPADLEQYQGWSNLFRRLSQQTGVRARQKGAVLVPMAGLGSRFAKEGYATPKPLIQISGRPMVIQATRDLPDAPETRFVLREALPELDRTIRKLRTSFVGAETIELSQVTDGQVISCLAGTDGLAPDAPLTIGACDNGMVYDVAEFERRLECGGPDVLIWTVRGHSDGIRRPEQFGWVDLDDDGAVCGARVRAPPEDPVTAPMVTGAFTFKRTIDFVRCSQRLVARNGRVNGEFYVDSLIEDALALGLSIEVFDIDFYIGWGTPVDLQIWEYWQSCFHKWGGHPYQLNKDARVAPASFERLEKRYAHVSPALPSGVKSASATQPKITDIVFDRSRDWLRTLAR
ncbi:MAG: NTP transferase domain-containing protein [Pseudomonadota bacterium]